jgi:hypothetical protein
LLNFLAFTMRCLYARFPGMYTGTRECICTVGYIDITKFLMYSVRGSQLLKIGPFRSCTKNFSSKF